jgi:hypothetical protein
MPIRLALVPGACRIECLTGGVASLTPGYFLSCLRHVGRREPLIGAHRHHPGPISTSPRETPRNQKSRCSRGGPPSILFLTIRDIRVFMAAG